MTCDIILTKKGNRYIARVKEWPEVVVEEKTRDAVIKKAKVKLLEYLTKEVEVIKVEIPLPNETGNPWLDKFGCFKDDPSFDDFQAEIAAYRKEVDKTVGT